MQESQKGGSAVRLCVCSIVMVGVPQSFTRVTHSNQKINRMSYSNNRAQTKRYCSKISDKALESLANECKNITEIKIRNCDRITDAGLLAVVGACEKLTRVDCFGCTLITDSAIRKAASIRTKLIFDR